MKKLAVLVDTFPRWSERFIARELAELRRRGVDLTVFCLKEGTLPAPDSDWAGLLECRRVLPAWHNPRVIFNALMGVTELGDAPRRRRFSDALSAGPINLIRLCPAHLLEKILIRENFEHVHGHFANLPSSLAWAAAVGASLPLTISVHARDLFVEPQLLKQKLAASTRIFTCHAHAQSHLTARAGEHASKVQLMHHGLPLDQYPFTTHERTAAAPLKLLCAGRLVEKKGILTLLEALKRPGLAALPLIVTIAGDGPQRETLNLFIDANGLTNRVGISLPLAGANLQSQLTSADVLIAPFREAADGDIDGVPNIVLEAFALGLPVIGTQAGGLGEVLSPETGTVVPFNDPQALASAIAAFATDRDVAKKTIAARELIEKNYDIRKNIEPLAKLLE